MYDEESRKLMKEQELDEETFDDMYHEFYGYTKDWGTEATRAMLEKVCKDIGVE